MMTKEVNLVDMLDAASVEVLVDSTGKVWINVNGACALRIGHADIVVIDDHKRGLDVVYEKKVN